MVTITQEQNIIHSKIQLDDITHEQIIICKQLFSGHVVSFRQKKSFNALIHFFSRLLSSVPN